VSIKKKYQLEKKPTTTSKLVIIDVDADVRSLHVPEQLSSLVYLPPIPENRLV